MSANFATTFSYNDIAFNIVQINASFKLPPKSIDLEKGDWDVVLRENSIGSKEHAPSTEYYPRSHPARLMALADRTMASMWPTGLVVVSGKRRSEDEIKESCKKAFSFIQKVCSLPLPVMPSVSIDHIVYSTKYPEIPSLLEKDILFFDKLDAKFPQVTYEPQLYPFLFFHHVLHGHLRSSGGSSAPSSSQHKSSHDSASTQVTAIISPNGSVLFHGCSTPHQCVLVYLWIQALLINGNQAEADKIQKSGVAEVMKHFSASDSLGDSLVRSTIAESS